MRTRELIKLLPTQFKRISENPLYSGHYIPHLGYWNKDEGFVRIQELEYKGETLACPIIAVVGSKIGGKDLNLTITAKTSVYYSTTEKEQDGYTLKRKTYKDSGETIQTTLTIPRFTRNYATFLITGLGKNVWSISSITADPEDSPGSVDFYALASNGSKLIYWFGIHNLVEELRQIIRPWIAPTKCVRCGGTGIEPNTSNKKCEECKGYKYSGYSSIKYVQRKIGFDLNLSRELLDWDELTDEDHEIIKNFINKCWTQKWWVTPTKKEIKRFFMHFYQVSEDEIRINERYSDQEPIWTLFLPQDINESSPFKSDKFTELDTTLIKYIGETITPAGVSIFLGFYKDLGTLGDMEALSDNKYMNALEGRTSIIEEYSLFGGRRIFPFNGWTKAIYDFEEESISLDSSGDVSLFNANDMNRHVVKLVDDSYIETDLVLDSGYFDFWIHPVSNVIRAGLRKDNNWLFYVEYDENGFYDNNGYLITLATPDNDYHVSVLFNNITGTHNISIHKKIIETGIQNLNTGISGKLRIESIGDGLGFVDAIGYNTGDYERFDNYPRLRNIGYGLNNECIYNSINVTDYVRKERFWEL
ncbi:MAG: hypothetical protein ACTSQY_00160 [Candidatus Odinarchaeia archaeon]|nr:MAG: hypothetical protein [Lokiarchaeota virus Fenrir Meg22_1012]URC17211.1 MAG: hypothetical protein [Lokiarchaeota virus Fenrir Meg22_1214]